MNYNALSLFSSAGVAETYFEKHGIHVKVAAELLPERASFYRHLYPNARNILENQKVRLPSNIHIVGAIIMNENDRDIQFDYEFQRYEEHCCHIKRGSSDA